jgi:outer membrane receptor protein involved in Fe transport
MSSGNYRILVLSVFFTLLMTCIVSAGTTGKIAGKVVDKGNHDPVIGANVLIVGTGLGTSTDLGGEFTILQVPPGVYSIQVSAIGYTKVTLNEIRVNIDQTARVSVQIESQNVELNETVIVAEISVVRPDVSTSVSSIEPEAIKSLPVTSISEVAGFEAGVEDGLVVRGGSADELLLQVDGMTRRDPRNNQPISNIALSSIKEVSIEKGGFNAEYGQVRSGIINIVEKEASVASYFGSATVKYSPPQQKYFGISVYDRNSMWNRPYLDPAVCWTGTDNGAWDIYTQNQYPKFFGGWNAVSQALLADNDPTNDLSPAAAQRLFEYQHRRLPNTKSPDYNIDGSFGGPVPIIGEELGNLRFFTSFVMNREMLLIPLSRPDYQDYNWSLKLNSDITKSMKLTLKGSIGQTYAVPINATDNGYYNQSYLTGGATFWNPTDFVRTPDQIAGVTYEQRSSRIFTDSWYSTSDIKDYNISGKLSATLSATTYYEVSVDNSHRSYLTDPIGARNTTKSFELVPGYFVDEAPFGYSSQLLSGIGDPSLFFGGHSATARDSSKLNTFTVKADMTSQITNEHMVKAGLEFSTYSLDMVYGSVNPAFSDLNTVNAKWNPYRISAYVQDKIEAMGFIANLGLRMDISDPNTKWVEVDPFDQAYFSKAYSDTINYASTSVKRDVSFSPRLGISHPITESSKLYFNYGHFKQMPAYEEIFRMGRGSGGDMRNYGDPNLAQAKTVSYELGFDQSLFETYLIQIAAFYHDITDQQAYTYYTSDRKSIAYYAANNNSYSDIRGVEITLKRTSGDWVRGFLNYTYQVTGTGQFGQVTIAEDKAQQAINDATQINPLYLLVRQKPVPQPRANASITLLTPKEFGPTFMGIEPLSDWTLNLLGVWRSGQWLTYNPQNASAATNNVQVTDYFNINLRLNKTFNFKSFAVTLFMETKNVLNTKRLSGESFYDIADYQAYMGSLHLPASQSYDNIPGDDKVGTYRTSSTYQPIERRGGTIATSEVGAQGVIYWERPTGRYMEYANGAWSEVDHAKMQKVLDDKTYIDMPNNSSFDFLNPRQFYFGVSLSFGI